MSTDANMYLIYVSLAAVLIISVIGLSTVHLLRSELTSQRDAMASLGYGVRSLRELTSAREPSLGIPDHTVAALVAAHKDASEIVNGPKT